MDKPSYFNSEHYPSPTEYYAELLILQREQERMKELHKYRPIVYICSPFSGDFEKNVINARRYSRFAVMHGNLPIAPHLLFPQFLNDADKDERELGLYMGSVLLSFCKEVWVFGKRISAGMRREINKARRKGIPIRYFNENLREES